MNLSIHEQFEDVVKQSSKKDKILKFQQYFKESKAMAIILDLTFNDKIRWLLPEGAPPYNANDKDMDLQHVLKNEARKLQYFINTREGLAMKPLRRETMFIELLEAVDHFDAKLLIAIKEKKLPYKGITKSLVKDAFPNETKGW